eukprot:TRINITY_DN4190_c0_g1_i2.p1 TRINITY_DN4190_c0_g1~~TRINITY_DN4190_c0_g1_i2.p1  ORF type:complete len:386 (-),score=52.67 TRINITY_DN4190_c0_g1_i2:64-1221(-)
MMWFRGGFNLKRRFIFISVVLLVNFASTCFAANPTGCQPFSSSNGGRYYAACSAGASLSAAQAAASAKGGYAVVITTSAEQAFLTSYFVSIKTSISGSTSLWYTSGVAANYPNDSNFAWGAGPESGTAISSGISGSSYSCLQASGYCGFSGGVGDPPSGAGADLVFRYNPTGDQTDWLDYDDTSAVDGYIIEFTSIAAPTISDVTPFVTSSGSTVTVRGTGFWPGSTVNFGTFSGSSVSIATSTELTVTSPTVSSIGLWDVIVNTVVDSNPFAVRYDSLISITFVSPLSWPWSGGKAASVFGSVLGNGTDVTSVQLVNGGTNYTLVITGQSSTQVDFISPRVTLTSGNAGTLTVKSITQGEGEYSTSAFFSNRMLQLRALFSLLR